MTVIRSVALACAAVLVVTTLTAASKRTVTPSDRGQAVTVVERVQEEDIRAFSGAVAHFLMGMLYDNSGDVKSAVSEYEKALGSRDDISEIYLKAGADLVIDGQPDKALELLSKVKEIDPTCVRAHMLSAVVHTAKGEYDLAEREYIRAADLEPGNIKALTFLSDLYVIQQKLDKAADLYEKILRVKKDDAFIFFNLGIIYSKLDKLDKAEENLEKAIEIDEGYIEAQVVLGYVYEIEGKYTAALQQYLKVSEIEPMNKEVHLRLGMLYHHLGQTDKAIEQNRILKRLDPYSPEPYLRNFSIYVSARRYDEAETVLREALRNGVSGSVIYVSLGYLAGLTGDNDKSADYYEVAVDKEPDNQAYRFYYAAALERTGKKDEAIEMLEKLVSIEPEDLPEAYNYLGYLYVEKGRELDRAIELIKRALESDPDNGAYLDSLGWAYLKKKMYPEALLEMKKAVLVMPDDPVVREHLGDAYFANGDLGAALSEWETSLYMAPDNENLILKIERLDRKTGVTK